MAHILRREIYWADLPRPSWVKISQVRTISTERIGKRIGEVEASELNQIIEGLTELVS